MIKYYLNKVLLQSKIHKTILLSGALALIPPLCFASGSPAENSTTSLKNKDITTLTPFVAHYKVSRGSITLGKAKRQLSQISDNEYVFSYASDLSFLILSDERKESAHIKIQDGQLKPIKYRYKREGTGSNKETILTFDTKTGTVLDSELNQEIECEKKLNWFDPISYQLQLKRDLATGKKIFNYYFINDDKKEKFYQFEIIGQETITLTAGTFDSIKLRRIRSNKKRITELWVAPELGYLMLRIRQEKNGSEQLDAQLQSVNFN